MTRDGVRTKLRKRAKPLQPETILQLIKAAQEIEQRSETLWLKDHAHERVLDCITHPYIENAEGKRLLRALKAILTTTLKGSAYEPASQSTEVEQPFTKATQANRATAATALRRVSKASAA